MNQPDIESRSVWLRGFTVVAVIEAITWSGLLVGMYLKYVPETTELGVRIFGSLHGAAFISYVLITIIVARQQKWRIRWTTLIALAASVPPFGTIAFELWARKNDLLSTAPGGRRGQASTPEDGTEPSPSARTLQR